MPTDNPKISAYVPQSIYDRFKQFQDEQGLSMSQAVAVALAQFFGIEETLKEITKGTTIGGITLARFEALENNVQMLLQKVEYLESHSSLLKESSNEKSIELQILGEIVPNIDKIDKLDDNKEFKAEIVNKILDQPSVPLHNIEIEQGKEIDSNKLIESVTNGELESKLPIQEEVNNIQFEEEVEQKETANKPLKSKASKNKAKSKTTELQGSLLSELPLHPLLISGIKLSKERFNLNPNSLASYKIRHSDQEFIKWSKEHDPDGIAWQQVTNPKKGYVPYGELSSEQEGKLLDWVNENVSLKF